MGVCACVCVHVCELKYSGLTLSPPLPPVNSPGDVIDLVSTGESGWWQGTCHGETGFFPASYAQVGTTTHTTHNHTHHRTTHHHTTPPHHTRVYAFSSLKPVCALALALPLPVHVCGWISCRCDFCVCVSVCLSVHRCWLPEM